MKHTFYWILLLICGVYCTSATLSCKNSETNATYIMPNTDPVNTFIESLLEKKTLQLTEKSNRLEAKINELMINENLLENKTLQLTENFNKLETKVDEIIMKINDLQKPRNCQEIDNDGIYKISPDFGMKNGVLCHRGHGKYEGVWTVVAQRFDGSENFNRNWSDYKHGFGNLSGEFFIGLEPLHAMTTGNDKQQLLIIIKDWNNVELYAKYKTFAIDDELHDYAINELGSYSGNASDTMRHHLNRKFSTKDRDNDQFTRFNCAKTSGGPWWFYYCDTSHLFGKYSEAHTLRTLIWQNIETDVIHEIKYVQMLIKPTTIQR